MTLRRYTPLRTRKRLASVNPERRAAMFARNFGDHAAFVRSRPCLVLTDAKPGRRGGCSGRMEAAHVRGRGMSGCGGDKRDLVPACHRHHDEIDGRSPLPDGGIGRAAFAAYYGIDDLDAVAARLWAANPENGSLR